LDCGATRSGLFSGDIDELDIDSVEEAQINDVDCIFYPVCLHFLGKKVLLKVYKNDMGPPSV